MFLFIENGIYSDHAGVTNLNTSHVLIYQTQPTVREPILPYLNTSHVLIYLYVLRHTNSPALHLNTSHVLIYPDNLIIFKYSSPI